MRSSFFLILLGVTMNAMLAFPSLEEYYDATKISVPAGEKGQFAYGDNIAGYYENATHGYRQGQGYLFKSRNLFGDCTAVFNNIPLNKTKEAKGSEILISGVRTLYTNGTTEEIALFPHQLGLGIEIRHPSAAQLGSILLFNELSSSSTLSLEKNIILIKRSEKATDIPAFIAISADAPFTWEQVTKPEDWLRQKSSLLTLKIQSTKPTTNFHIFIAFGFSESEAIIKASRWAATSYFTSNKIALYEEHTKSYLWTDDPLFNQAVAWSLAGSYLFVVEEFGKGIWAGLPWFRDNWGRDTFISLPGTLLVSGHFDDAKGVITNFSTYQNRGIPYIEVLDNETNARVIKNRLGELFQKDAVLKGSKVSLSLDNNWLDKPKEIEKRLSQLKQEFSNATINFTVITNKELGRVPNRVAAGGSIIYNTTDGTPWLIREVYEYLSYTGDTNFIREIYPTVVLALNGAIQNYVDDKGFLTHGDQDTWMDASRGPGKEWSPRGNRAVEIQALWANALRVGIELATLQGDNENASRWQAVYNNLTTNFARVFWNDYHKNVADRVLADGTQDMRIRPNALMLFSVPLFEGLLPLEKEALVIKKTISELLFPYGIASLSPRDIFFHPYHDNQPNYHKDAAYHNGTVWGWNAGFTITALLKHGYTELAYKLTTNLAHQILFMGCRGNMSELIDAIPDAQGRIKLSGTYAQAWSIAEFARNAFQDYLGVRPDLLKKSITFEPHIPSQWKHFTSRVALDKGSLSIEYSDQVVKQYTITWHGKTPLTLAFIDNNKGKRTLYNLTLQPEEATTLTLANETVSAKGEPLSPVAELQPSLQNIIGELTFAQPTIYPQVQAHKQKDFLKTIIDKKEYNKYLPKTKGGLFGW